MKKLIYVSLAIILLGAAGALIVLSKNNNTSVQNNLIAPENIEQPVNGKIDQKVESTLETDKKDFDFGNIPIYGGKVSTKFRLKNTGSQELTLTSITTSCMCTEATIDDKTFGMPMGGHNMYPEANIKIPAQSTKEITVTFDPLAHGDDATGPVSRIISIETDSNSTPLIEMRISGNVVKP